MRKNPNLLLSIFFLSFLLSQSVFSQSYTLEFIRSIPISEPISISVDKNDCLFIADNRGSINKYDSLGKLLLTYSPLKLGDIQILEAWQTVRVFAFYRDFQEFAIMDRFLNLKNQYEFPEELLGFARVATISVDDNLWVFDDGDFSIKKIDVNQRLLLVHNSMDLILDNRDYSINFIKEYQNLLFINDFNSGILVYDNLGNYRKKINHQGLNYFGVFDNYIYFIKNKDQLLFHHLYDLTEFSIPLPNDFEPLFAARLKNKLLLVGEKKLAVYQIHQKD